MQKIIIEVSGGNIQEIYSTEEDENVSIYVVDWDNIEAGEVDDIRKFPIQFLTNTELDNLLAEANYEIKLNRDKYN